MPHKNDALITAAPQPASSTPDNIPDGLNILLGNYDTTPQPVLPQPKIYNFNIDEITGTHTPAHVTDPANPDPEEIKKNLTIAFQKMSGQINDILATVDASGHGPQPFTWPYPVEAQSKAENAPHFKSLLAKEIFDPLEANKYFEQQAVPLKAQTGNIKYTNELSATTITGVDPAPAITNKQAHAQDPGIAKDVVDAIAVMAARNDVEQNLLSKGMWVANDSDLTGTYSYAQPVEYVTDTKRGSADAFNMYVSNAATLNVDEKQAADFDNYEAFVTDRLMANFVSGKGPENYNFPTNGIISSKFLQSDILKAALKDFYSGDLKPGISKQYSFGAGELADDMARTGTLFSSITGFTGSGTITIDTTSSGLQVKIFNITGLTSGDLFKNPHNDAGWPKSYIRDPKKITPYGNISQTYNLFIPYDNR